MRVFFLVFSLISLVVLSDVAEAGRLSAPGPNPNWTRMQKFEWYLGYMSRAAQVCGNYDAAGTLHALARMTPYGGAGMSTVMGDGFAGPVCGRINKEAGEMAADAEQIQAYIETTYNCTGEGCHGQKLSDWQFHVCADSLKEFFATLPEKKDDISEVSLRNTNKVRGDVGYQARVRFNSCEGSLYVDFAESCTVKSNHTRGDCSIEGIKPY